VDAYALSLKFQTEGFDDVFRKLDQVDEKGRRATRTHNESGASLERIGHKAAGVAIALSGMEEVGISAVEKIAHGATNVAFMFGGAGPIVAAAAITGVAIFSIFTNARKEMEATDLKARQLLKALTLDTGATRMTELFSGDVGAKPGSPAALGLERARAEAERLRSVTPDQRFGAASGLPIADQFADQRVRLKELDAWIKENGKSYDDTRAKVEQLTIAETDRARLIVEEGDKQRAEEAAKLGLTRAMGAGTSALHAADEQIKVIMALVNTNVEKNSPTIEKLLQESVAKGLSMVPGAGQGIFTPSPTQGSGMLSAFGVYADALAQRMRENITSIFGDAITEGFAAAFSGRGLGGVFKALARTILQGLGQIFMSMGQKMVAASALMSSFQKAITSFFPGGGLVAGLALMALGGAMMGASGGLGGGGAGSGGGGDGGSSGYSNAQEDITRIRLMPSWAGGEGVSGRNNVTVNATIIGANDPSAQRAITELIRNAERRGL
jgi:hypothetical protein